MGVAKQPMRLRGGRLKKWRKLGQEVLQGWLGHQSDIKEAESSQKADLIRDGKKKCIGTVPLVPLESKNLFSGKDGRGKRQRPLSASIGVQCRGYSKPLQRAMVDFGADVSFAAASQKLKEHYGIDIPSSSIRARTLHHSQRCFS